MHLIEFNLASPWAADLIAEVKNPSNPPPFPFYQNPRRLNDSEAEFLLYLKPEKPSSSLPLAHPRRKMDIIVASQSPRVFQFQELSPKKVSQLPLNLLREKIVPQFFPDPLSRQTAKKVFAYEERRQAWQQTKPHEEIDDGNLSQDKNRIHLAGFLLWCQKLHCLPPPSFYFLAKDNNLLHLSNDPLNFPDLMDLWFSCDKPTYTNLASGNMKSDDIRLQFLEVYYPDCIRYNPDFSPKPLLSVNSLSVFQINLSGSLPLPAEISALADLSCPLPSFSWLNSFPELSRYSYLFFRPTAEFIEFSPQKFSGENESQFNARLSDYYHSRLHLLDIDSLVYLFGEKMRFVPGGLDVDRLRRYYEVFLPFSGNPVQTSFLPLEKALAENAGSWIPCSQALYLYPEIRSEIIGVPEKNFREFTKLNLI